MKADADKGRLDQLIQRARADIKANKVKFLEDIL